MRSQRRGPHQRRSGSVDGAVDALMTQPHVRVVTEPGVQVTADLLRAPPLRQQLGRQPPQLDIGVNPEVAPANSSRTSTTVRVKRPVTTAAADGRIAAQL